MNAMTTPIKFTPNTTTPDDREALRQRVINAWRTPRTTPRPGFAGHPRGFEDPAPPWVCVVVDTVLRRIGPRRGGTLFAAVEWCAAGDAPHRAEQLCTIVRLWPGPDVSEAIDQFLMDANATGAGRARGAKARHVGAVHVPRDWEEHDRIEANRRKAGLAPGGDGHG